MTEFRQMSRILLITFFPVLARSFTVISHNIRNEFSLWKIFSTNIVALKNTKPRFCLKCLLQINRMNELFSYVK